MRRGAVLAMFIVLFSASPVLAEFYRWVDKDGKEFFSNERENIPQEYRGGASTVKPDESRVSVGDTSVARGKSEATVREHKDKYGKGEEHWHKRAASLRRELKDLQAEYDLLLKHEQNQNQEKVVSRKNKSVASRDKKKIQLEKKITTAKRKLEVDLPEDARKADAYPGWIRE
jgi:hypothetical protein